MMGASERNNVGHVAVLGVDPGSQDGLGWAVMEAVMTGPATWGSPGLVASGVLKTARMDKDDRSQLWGMLDEMLAARTPGVSLVAYERVHRHNGVHAAHIYGGQVAVIQRRCTLMGVPWTPVQVATVKRFLACKAAGKAKERAMVEAAHRLGYTSVTDSNEADAVGIALAGIEAWKTGLHVYGNLRKS